MEFQRIFRTAAAIRVPFNDMDEATSKRYKRAVDLRAAGKASEALPEFRALRTSVAGGEEAELLLDEVTCLIELGNLSVAEATLSQLKRLHRNPILELGSDLAEGDLFLHQKRPQQALEAFDRSLEAHVDLARNSDFHPIFERIRMGRAFAL